MVTHPTYTIAAPDILFIDAVRLIPKPPYRIEPLEVLLINVTDTLPNQPISARTPFRPKAPSTSASRTAPSRRRPDPGSDSEQRFATTWATSCATRRSPSPWPSSAACSRFAASIWSGPTAPSAWAPTAAVYVAGMTLARPSASSRNTCREYLLNPEIVRGRVRLQQQGLLRDLRRRRLWPAGAPLPDHRQRNGARRHRQRPGPGAGFVQAAHLAGPPVACTHPCNQILPVDWKAITEGGSTARTTRSSPATASTSTPTA